MFILFLLAALTFAGGVYVFSTILDKFIKNKALKTMPSKVDGKIGGAVSCFALSAFFFVYGIIAKFNWELTTKEMILSFGGALIFGAGLSSLIAAFKIYFYKEDYENKKTTFKVMIISIVPTFIGLVMALCGLGNHFIYPLTSGFTFGNGSFISTFDFESKHAVSGGLSIAFYGILMITGVIVVYYICDHEFYKEYQKHGILDSVVVLVFPAGVIGARVGYVIGEWNKGHSGLSGWDYWIVQGNCLKIWNGGLTILGGALGGILAGVIFVKLRRKYVNVRWAMDVIVPTILVAQAIGRWGNFFNHEVYGARVSMDDWMFLPNFIRNQMAISFTNGKPTSNEMYVPLFLIESIVNLIGYFLIKYGMGRLVPKKLPLGSLSGGYLIWYGITRIIMEPLRDPEFNMGDKGIWSNIWAIIYVVLGLLLIALFFLLDKTQKNKEETKA